jgi:hypothetical protein
MWWIYWLMDGEISVNILWKRYRLNPSIFKISLGLIFTNSIYTLFLAV